MCANHRKLCLVLDLDNTLLHTTSIDTLSPEEGYLKHSSNGDIFRWGCSMITKLRPYVRDFLKETSKFFDLYIYTMGDRNYASRMTAFLDPDNIYFNMKVLSREDCTNRQKCLDVVPVPESRVLILDDKKSVWKRNSDNLIKMEKYIYFAKRSKGDRSKSYSEQRSDENESEGALSSVLQVLKSIHTLFFLDSNIMLRDVRLFLGIARIRVLLGCHIVFRQGATMSTKRYCRLWNMAVEMGATCSSDERYKTSITHVVSTDANSSEARWAVTEGKFLVDPKWITAAYFLWKRQPEGKFNVNQMDSCFVHETTYSGSLLGKRIRCDDGAHIEKRPIRLRIVSSSCHKTNSSGLALGKQLSCDDGLIAPGLEKRPIRLRIVTSSGHKTNSSGLVLGKRCDDGSTSQDMEKKPTKLRIVSSSGHKTNSSVVLGKRCDDGSVSQGLGVRPIRLRIVF